MKKLVVVASAALLSLACISGFAQAAAKPVHHKAAKHHSKKMHKKNVKKAKTAQNTAAKPQAQAAQQPAQKA